MREVLAALTPPRQSQPGPADAPAGLRAIAVAGMAGVGKTELAKQAARAAVGNGWFPGGVLFIDLFGYDPARCIEPAKALDDLLRDLAVPPELIPLDTQGRARLYVSALAAYVQHDRPVLVFIDNASSVEQAQALLPDDPDTGAIVTSRETLGTLGIRQLDLDILAVPDAVTLLDRALKVRHPDDTRVTNDPDGAKAIAGLCAGLPLALQLIAALLADDPSQPLAAMVADLSGPGTRLAELRYGQEAVDTAFRLSYQRLDPEPALIFRLLPVGPGPDISTQSAAVLAGLDGTAARHGLMRLARAHLLAYGASYGRWRLHDLIRLYAEEQGLAQAGEDHREQAIDRLLDYFLHTAQAADQCLRALPGTPAPLTSLTAPLPWPG